MFIAKKVLFLSVAMFLFVAVIVQAQGVNVTSVKSGRWANADTWDINAVPQDKDVPVINIITINAEHIISLDPEISLTKTGVNRIIILGTLLFDVSGKSFRLPGNTIFEIGSGASIRFDGGNGPLFIGSGDGRLVWRGNDGGDIVGPTNLNRGGLAPFVPLPVTLLSFTAKEHVDSNIISWTTVDEKAFSHFEVERSTNGLQFDYVGEALSRGNELTGTYEYRFIDNPESQLTYYRLKMVDLDGTFEYSDVVAVNRGGEAMLSIFPNPAANGSFRIMQSGPEAEATLTIYNVAGHQVEASTFQLSAIPIDYEPSVALQHGTYYVTVTVNNQVFREKLIIH